MSLYKYIAVILAFCIVLTPTVFASAQVFETHAKRAFIIDETSGKVLFSRMADESFQPGSLAKLMTAELAFNALKNGSIKLEDTYYVSEHAWRTGGAPSRTTTMFAGARSMVPVDAIIHGLTILMANDAAIILAEGMAGSEANFARLMTQRAEKLGLHYTTFSNPTGFSGEGQSVTAREITQLAQHLWNEYPDYYQLYSRPDFEWNKIFQRNKNPLNVQTSGIDGLVSGYVEGFGYSIAASATDGNRRIFATLAGFESDSQRFAETQSLLQLGLENFQNRKLFSADEIIGRAVVYGGEESEVSIKVKQQVEALAPINNPEALTTRFSYSGPLPAPIQINDEIGQLQIWIGDTLSWTEPVYAAETVEIGTLKQRTFSAIAELLVGWMR